MRALRSLLPPAAVLVVACAQAAFGAPSAKRGVCAQGLAAADWRALSPGVSWWYNWSFEPDSQVPQGGPAFIPMLWGDSPGLWKGFERALKNRPPRVLVLNEPNLRSQANLRPSKAAKAWTRARKLTERYGVPLVGPQLSLGCPANDCVEDLDPIQRKRVTYTWLVPFVDAFLAHLPEGAKPVLAVHPYGNVGELKWAVGEAAKRSGGPVWVTEFNEWKAPNEDAQLAYMKEAVAFMEASPDVAGYAWFMARAKDRPGISLLGEEPGRLTRLGEAYLSLP